MTTDAGRHSTSRQLTTSQVAVYGRCSEVQIRRWCREGKLKHTWTPLGRLFERDDVEAFFVSRREAE